MKKFIFVSLLIVFSVISLLANVTAEEVVTVRVEQDSILATFVIPEDMHLTVQEDYFYLDVDPIEGVTLGETIYPDGEADKDGYVNLHGTIYLTKKFTIADGIDKSKVIFQIYTGFQLCFEAYCEPPVDSEFSIPLVPTK